mgnify:CR=1 FL=1
MMEKLRAKLKNQGGFTLIEMLIVVAIIAILIAVSIPMVSSALERAREATDSANERSAVALAEIKWLTSQDAAAGSTDAITWNAKKATFYYKVSGANGTLETAVAAPTAGDAGYNYGKCSDHNGQYLIIELQQDDGTVHLKWSSGTKTSHGGYTTIS